MDVMFMNMLYEIIRELVCISSVELGSKSNVVD